MLARLPTLEESKGIRLLKKTQGSQGYEFWAELVSLMLSCNYREYYLIKYRPTYVYNHNYLVQEQLVVIF
jgi:hypothetical protein